MDIIQRCPGLRILISGHTDSDGSNASNQVLSEKRAKSVVEAIGHPLVTQADIDFLCDLEASGISRAVLEIPLLFETGAETYRYLVDLEAAAKR